jgi:hypothetical protein
MRNAGMDDLVKRLRMVYGNHTEADIALHREAADEIDRLRELLQRALFAFQHKGVVRGIDEWCEQAEAAIRADAAQPAAQEPADCRCPGYCFARTGNRHRLPGNVRCGITGLLAHPADAAQEPRPLMYEDELPDMSVADYDRWYAQSRIVDGVRMGPRITEPRE